MRDLETGRVTLALPPGVTRWTLSGRSSAEEVWAFDWWTAPGTGMRGASMFQDVVNGYNDVCTSENLYNQICQLLNPDGSVNELKGTYYRDSQKATYVAAHTLNPAPVGTSDVHMPLQQSLCVTTLTEIPGRSTRGRLYLPACGAGLSNARLFAAPTLASVIGKLANVINAGRTDGRIGPPVVVSRTETIATPITALRWDLRPDIQRRRADKQSDGGRTLITL